MRHTWRLPPPPLPCVPGWRCRPESPRDRFPGFAPVAVAAVVPCGGAAPHRCGHFHTTAFAVAFDRAWFAVSPREVASVCFVVVVVSISAGSGSVAVQCDITNDDSVKGLVAAAAQLCGDKGVHAVVNNAGIARGSVVDMTDLPTYQVVMDVNFYGGVRVTKALLPLVVRASVYAQCLCSRVGNGGMVTESVPSSCRVFVHVHRALFTPRVVQWTSACV